MFQKKDYVYADELGVCRVEEITNLMQKDGNVLQYYGLRSMMVSTKTAYFPVENHEINIRELITLDEANTLLEGDTENLPKEKLYEAKFVIELDKKLKAKGKAKK